VIACLLPSSLRLALGSVVFVASTVCAQVLPSKVQLQVEGEPVLAWMFVAPEKHSPDKKSPAIVALHGCGGLYSTGRSAKPFQLNPRHEDYAQLLAADGYVVLFVDSFSSRGVASICTDKERKIRPQLERVKDAAAGLAYLAALPQVDAKRIGLLGWSNGGSTVLHTMDQQAKQAKNFSLAAGQQFSAAISFYPGCTGLNERGTWKSNAPLKLMLGGKDNWTPAAPCEALVASAKAQGQAVSVEVYPEAVHDFDAPHSALRERTGLAFTADGSGRAWVGTHMPSRLAAQATLKEFFATYLRP
jgi:dienelactone hydrolase